MKFFPSIEINKSAAEAFERNHPNTLVFNDDCNLLLKKILEADKKGQAAIYKGKNLPKKGQVDILCGGPPCQGFSNLNRHNKGQNSTFKNTGIPSYFSYCDFYRPKWFILENVRNFANFNESVVFKKCLQALLKMGYQCTFGVLQAGHYGVAQSRHR